MRIHTHKIGMNRGAMRLWLEGKRLTDSGFHAGLTYTLQPRAHGFALVLSDSIWETMVDDEGSAKPRRRISGKAGKPIIDISGRTITQTFPNGGNVRVFYGAGFIDVETET